jgi:hypothetical protein
MITPNCITVPLSAYFTTVFTACFPLTSLGLILVPGVCKAAVVWPGGIIGPPVPGEYKYGNLAVQVGGVSNETVKYGFEF